MLLLDRDRVFIKSKDGQVTGTAVLNHGLSTYGVHGSWVNRYHVFLISRKMITRP